MNKLHLLVLRAQDVLTREEGQDLIEYALLAGLIALAAVAAIGTIGNDINNLFTSVGSTLNTAIL